MLTYADAEAFVLALDQGRIDLRLERLTAFLAAIGDPHKAYPSVVIGGTNGKGSVAAIVSTVLAQHHSVGTFIKPHLVTVRERVRLNMAEVGEEKFAAAVDFLAAKMRETGIALTYFEFTFVLAAKIFADEGVRIAVFEVGLGGRLDACNVVTPILSVITTIDYDHQKFLGNTLAEIAFEKAGIIKERTPVIVGDVPPVARRVIEGCALPMRAAIVPSSAKVEAGDVDLTRGIRTFHAAIAGVPVEAECNLVGRYQAANLRIALDVLMFLAESGFFFKLGRESLARVNYRARFEVVKWRDRRLILDAAHNPEGMRALAESLREILPKGATLPVVFGCQRGKDLKEELATLKPFIATLYPIEMAILHPMEKRLIQHAAEKLSIPVADTPSFTAALDACAKFAPPDGFILACGSIYYLGEIIKFIEGM